jgi:hypothetical protein
MKNTKMSETNAFWGTLRKELGVKPEPSHNGKVPQVLFGKVTQFNPERKFGIVVVDYSKIGGIKRGFSLSTNNGPFAIGLDRNSSFPVFVKLTDVYPPTGAEIALEVSGVNGTMRVNRWSSAKTYREVEEILKSRRGAVSDAIYRVIRNNDRFMGQRTSTRLRDQIVFEGTLRQLEAESRRDGLPISTTDVFAPVYENELFSARNRFEKRDATGEWVSCDDPRPFPATGPVYRLMYWKDSVDTELAIGQALRINLKFPRGDKDPLGAYILDEAFSGGYLYWLRQEPKTFNVDPKNPARVSYSNETVWVETSDPRPVPAKINKIVKPVAKKPAARAPEAMPKTPPSKRQFNRTLKGFDALVLA